MKRRLKRLIPGFRRIKRAWRSRGFGIHSPFAFRFVTCVLRESGEYYAYRELRRIAGDRKAFRRLALVFRLVCEFRPAVVSVVGDSDFTAHIDRTVKFADSRIKTYSCSEAADPSCMQNPGFCIIQFARNVNDMDFFGRALRSECMVAFMDVSGADACGLRDLLTSGMSFYNRRTIILVSRHDLPRQNFEVNF
ncbi:hypothetical protein [uncultured Duncaniella sp.]|uniref:hypothetical protein n=1 Tax=uncultured Duncaniella sp. TaxID=2768039 RepID=UPI0025A96C52|nr:hypothetical protein [uncultured Duncaniella sp.]